MLRSHAKLIFLHFSAWAVCTAHDHIYRDVQLQTAEMKPSTVLKPNHKAQFVSVNHVVEIVKGLS